MHSAYERTAQFVARVDRIRAENPGVPCAVLIDGDTFELGNAVARRSGGAIEFAMLAALARRGPVVLNLGNHEPEFFGMAETVARLRATGAIVVGGNVLDRATGEPYAPARAKIPLGPREATIVGLTTDALATFRVAVRPELDLANPVVWARQHLPGMFRAVPLPIVLSHAGLLADREILPLVPRGTLFAGAHDHLRFVQRTDGAVYFHSGSWTAFVSIARLNPTEAGLAWSVEQQPIAADDPADPALAALIRETFAKYLTPEETAVIGRMPQALAPDEAARFAVEAARRAAGADVALVGATTFGAGLPAGDVTRFSLDACVRFDGTLFVGEVAGARLRPVLARANQGPDTPFAERTGENLVATGLAPAALAPEKIYRVVVNDWLARSAKRLFGDDTPAFVERPELKLKAAAISALAPAK